MKAISVVAARPNFIKIGPFLRALQAHNSSITAIGPSSIFSSIRASTTTTGCRRLFQDLGIPEADIHLGIGSGSHAEQVARTMIEFEKVLRAERPDWVVLVGDVNATIACSITAKKECIRVAHIEAGLRSGDLAMPEEINRMVTDRLSDLLFTPDRVSSANLRAEGVPEAGIKFVGNIMIDTLEREREKARRINLCDLLGRNVLDPKAQADAQKVRSREFAVVTLHRPANVDETEVLGPIVDFLTREHSLATCP